MFYYLHNVYDLPVYPYGSMIGRIDGVELNIFNYYNYMLPFLSPVSQYRSEIATATGRSIDFRFIGSTATRVLLSDEVVYALLG